MECEWELVIANLPGWRSALEMWTGKRYHSRKFKISQHTSRCRTYLHGDTGRKHNGARALKQSATNRKAKVRSCNIAQKIGQGVDLK
jgi:hypothetical protein